MATRREIRRRIRSIRNTAQITKAMQMVAASRMRRAQGRVAAARPYAEAIRDIVADISSRPGAQDHPLLAQRPVKNVEIVTITPDRGLAGALITNLNRETVRLARSIDHPIRIVAVGRKGRDFAVRSRWQLVAEYTNLGDHPGIQDISPVAQQVIQDYDDGTVDQVFLVYSRFISTLRQQPTAVQLLPVVPPEGAAQPAPGGGPWNYEPDNPQLVLSDLLPRYVEFVLYEAMLELRASFYSAQMVAMSNATDNALDLVKDLTLLMNKARQAEITKEIAEISGAAEAIRTG
jgi:F-type H+-transporting ATPase subunit gamma